LMDERFVHRYGEPPAAGEERGRRSQARDRAPAGMVLPYIAGSLMPVPTTL
jgi:hypothetical protein